MVDIKTVDYEALRGGAGCIVLADRRWIALSGQERVDYLQGLLTNDIAALSSGTGCYAAHLTPQGRLVADMYVFTETDRVLLDVHDSAKDLLCERFNDFIISEDVRVSDLSHQLSAYGVHGPRAAEILSVVVDMDPTSLDVYEHCPIVVCGSPGVIARTDDLGIAGYRVIVESETVINLGQALIEAGALEVGETATAAVRIESGRPLFPIDMNAETIPMEAGIEDRAINFDKGCYVGQEVIIRILHRGRGRVARRLVGLTLDIGDERDYSLQYTGAPILFANAEVGQVTSVALSPAIGTVVALGYVPREIADEPGVVLEVVVGSLNVNAVVTKLPFVPTL